ncbi:hypothetical protein GX408_16030, partial [bacterium]|nr:hypothetical protein [bacterium]
MRKIIQLWFVLIVLEALPVFAADSQSELPTPHSFFGFEPGADRSLIDYEALIAYLKKLDPVSSRMTLTEIGRSPMGRPMYAAFISS